MDDELLRMRKEVAVGSFKVLSQHLPVGIEKTIITSVRVANLWTEDQTWDLNMKQDCYLETSKFKSYSL